MASVRALAKALKRNNGDITELDIASKIRQLSWIARNESAPAGVRNAARETLQMARENSVQFALKKIMAAARRAHTGRARNPLARDGMLSNGTVRAPAAQPVPQHGGLRTAIQR